MFDTDGHGFIEVADLKTALRALGFEPDGDQVKRMVQDLNKTQQNRQQDKDKGKDGEVMIDFESFLDIMTTKMSEREGEPEL